MLFASFLFFLGGRGELFSWAYHSQQMVLCLVTPSCIHIYCSELGAWLSFEGEIGSNGTLGVQSIVRPVRLFLLEVN